MCPYALDGDGLRRLPRFLAGEAITIYHSAPSVFRSFSATLDGSEELSSLRIVRLGGEPIFASDFDPIARIASTGGPMKTMPAAAHCAAKSSFSERKP